MVRLEYVLDSWRSVRQDTAQTVEEFTGSPDYRAVPELMSFGETARHILDASHGLTGMLLDGVTNFATPEVRERMKEFMPPLGANPDRETLAGELRTRFEERAAELAGRPPEFYSETITRFDGQRVTRLEMVEAVKDHELTHRAYLFFCLRMNGMVPPTTRRRQAKK